MKSLVRKPAWFLVVATLIGIPQTSWAQIPNADLLDSIEFSEQLSVETSTTVTAVVDISPVSTPATFPPQPKKVIFYPLEHSLQQKAESLDSLKPSALAPIPLFEGEPNIYTNYTNINHLAQLPLAPPKTPAVQAESTSEPAGESPSLRLVSVGDYQVPPSISVAMPFAYGLFWRNVGIGLGLQERTRYTNEADGGLGMSVGLGNPQKSIGFDVGVSIFDLSEFASRGAFSFKIHRSLPDDWAIALGMQNAIVWGYTDAGTSVYGVVTKTFRLQETVEKPFSLLVVSGGIGSGQFRSESDINNDISSVGVFGSMALRAIEPLNAIAEWTGQDLTLGLSYLPFQNTPLVLTGALTDLTGNAGDGSRFIVRIGYIFSF